jgi:hypothetical protein
MGAADRLCSTMRAVHQRRGVVSPDIQSNLQTDERGNDRPVLAGAIVLAALAVSMALAAASRGCHHDDDLTHYLFARWAWIWPQYLLHEWGRPGFTILHFLPAWFGWLASRWMSGVLSAATAWLAYCIARRQKLPYPWLVPVLVFAQPMFLTLSYTTLTETALAFYIAAAAYLLLVGSPAASAAVLSLGLTARYEAVVLLPIWVVALWRCKRRWPAMALLLWAPLIHNALAPSLLEQSPVLKFLEPKPLVDYGRGHWTTFVVKTLIAFGPTVMCLAVAGARSVWRRPLGRLIVACCVVYLAAQTILRASGSYGSGGYARFLVPIAPLIGILACAGLGELLAHQRRRAVGAVLTFGLTMLVLEGSAEWELRAADVYWLGRETWVLRFTTLGVVLVCGGALWLARRGQTRWWRWLVPATAATMATMQLGGQIRPMHLKPDQAAMYATTQWLREQGLTDRPIVVANLWFEYFLGQARSPKLRLFCHDVAKAPPGAIIAWDKRYGSQVGSGLPLSALRDHPGQYRLLYRSPSTRHDGVFVYVFEKLGRPPASTCPTDTSKI